MLGFLGGLVGVGVGALLVRWIVEVSVSETVPDIGIAPTVSGQSILLALALGVVTVALTPLLSIRRLRRTDLPSTLRVVE